MFEIRNVAGRGILRPDNLSSDWSLREVRLTGVDVTDVPVDFSGRDITDVEVVLTRRNPSIAGAVFDERGRSINLFSVVIFPVDQSRWDYPSRFVGHAEPDQSGHYRIVGLPPAEYLVVAVPPMANGAWQDPEWLERLRPLAQTVTLGLDEKKGSRPALNAISALRLGSSAPFLRPFTPCVSSCSSPRPKPNFRTRSELIRRRPGRS